MNIYTPIESERWMDSSSTDSSARVARQATTTDFIFIFTKRRAFVEDF